MKWSWKLGRIAGIDLYVHGTFLILLAWVGLVHYLQGHDLLDAVHGLVFMAAIFGVVVLHELGHALAARRYGIGTRDITLLPIGGVARLERMPEKPRQELVVALAGPFVNVVLAGICLVVVEVLAGACVFTSTAREALGELEFLAAKPSQLAALSDLPLMGAHFFGKLFWANVGLALFNLLPAFPMDGGRVLRALLALRLDYARSTRIAAGVGQAMALVFGFVGLFANPFLVLVALFVWMGAAAESSAVQMRSALSGVPISRAMVTEFRTVSPEEPLSRVVEHVLAGFQQDFPVLDRGRVAGILTRHDLLTALASRGDRPAVGEFMCRNICTAEATETLDQVFSRLSADTCHSIAVVHRGDLVGLVTMDNVGEFLMIQAALNGEGKNGLGHNATRQWGSSPVVGAKEGQPSWA